MKLDKNDLMRIERSVRRDEAIEVGDILKTKVSKSKKAYSRKGNKKNYLLEE